MKRSNANKHYVVAHNSQEIAKALGIKASADVALMEFKAQLSALAEKAIAESGLSVNDIVKKSGVARSKVSAIKNGALAGISSDLFLKVIAATGSRLLFKLTA